MGLAHIGLLTTVTEAAATAVGAGVVLSSVAVGIWGIAVGRPMVEVETWALKGGYFGGGFGAVLALVDAILRYGVGTNCLQAEAEMGSMRYMNIGLAVAVAILIAGVIAFRNSSKAAMQATVLVAMFVGLALGVWLDTRAQRRNGKRAQ